MSIEALKNVYKETQGKNGLIALTQELRESESKYTQKREAILSVFRNKPLWEEKKSADGHAKFVHQLSGRVVGFQMHGDNTLKPEQALSLLEVTQDHLNFFCNEIFLYKSNNWKKEPDYKESLKRYQEYEESKKITEKP